MSNEEYLDPNSTDPNVKKRLKELAEKRAAAALQRQQSSVEMTDDKEVNVDTGIMDDIDNIDNLENENEDGIDKDLGKDRNKGGNGNKKLNGSNSNSNLNSNLGIDGLDVDGNDNKMEMAGGGGIGNRRKMGKKRQFTDDEAMEKARQEHVHAAMGQYFRKEITYDQLQVILHSLGGSAASSSGGNGGNAKKKRKRGGRRSSGMVSNICLYILSYFILFISLLFYFLFTKIKINGVYSPLKTKITTITCNYWKYNGF